MKTKLTSIFALLLPAACLPMFAQGTAFTYHGQLNDGSILATRIYDLKFTLYDAFGLGSGETTITTVDADGMAVATIQGLNQKMEDERHALRAELQAKEKRITELENRLERLSPQEIHQ